MFILKYIKYIYSYYILNVLKDKQYIVNLCNYEWSIYGEFLKIKIQNDQTNEYLPFHHKYLSMRVLYEFNTNPFTTIEPRGFDAAQPIKT